MSEYTGIQIVWGVAGPVWNDDDLAAQALDIFRKNGIKDLDCTPLYPGAEANAGMRSVAKDFNLNTKFSHVMPTTAANLESIEKALKESLEKLQTDQVDVYYLHAPTRHTPLEETLVAIDTLYKRGHFRRFGLSNYLPEEVEEVVRIAKEKGLVAPSVYQGNYSAVARRQEEKLFPVLRAYNIAFQAYSPIAGGFLTKTREHIEKGASLRWDKSNILGQTQHALYNKPAYLDALGIWERISQASGIPRAELAYRWVAHNSPLKRGNGDSLVFGTKSLEQLRETIRGLKNGPLPGVVARQIDEIWPLIQHEAGLDNFNLNNTGADDFSPAFGK